MPVAFVQQTPNSGGSGSSFTATLPGSIGAGNALVCLVAINSGTVSVSSITGANGETYTKAFRDLNSTDGVAFEAWYALNVPTGGGVAVTVNLSASARAAGKLAEFSGVATVSALDTSNHTNGNSTAPATGTVSTANGVDVLVGGDGLKGAPVTTAGPSNSFTALSDSNTGLTGSDIRLVSAYRIVTATGSYSTDWTVALATGWSGGIVALKSQKVTLAAAVSAAGSDSGAVKVAHALAGLGAGVGSDVGAVKVAHALAGVGAGAGSDSGAVKVAHALAGVAAGAGSDVAPLKVAHALAGIVAGAGSDSGAVNVAHALAAAAAGVGSDSGLLRVGRSLSGSAAGVLLIEATMSPLRGLSASSDGSSVSAAPLAVAHGLSGASVAGASVAAQTQIGHGLSGGAAGVGDVAASTLRMRLGMAGASAALTSVSAWMVVAHRLAGLASGSGASVAAARVAHSLAASSSGVAQVRASLFPLRLIEQQTETQHAESGGLSVTLGVASKSGAPAGAGAVSVTIEGGH